jgi:hypothetical protein
MAMDRRQARPYVLVMILIRLPMPMKCLAALSREQISFYRWIAAAAHMAIMPYFGSRRQPGTPEKIVGRGLIIW